MRFMRYTSAGECVDDALPVTSATLSETIGDEWSDTLSLDVAATVDKGDYIVFRDRSGLWREYRVASPDDLREDSKPTSNVQAVNSVQELAVTRNIDWFQETGIGPGRALDVVLQGTRWSRSADSADIGDDGIEPMDVELSCTDGWAALKDIASQWGLEISTGVGMGPAGLIETRLVTLTPRRGRDTGRRWELGGGLDRVRRTYDDTECYCRVKPIGRIETGEDDTGVETTSIVTIAPVNDGLDYLETDDPAATLARWGVPDRDGNLTPTTKIVQHSDVTDPGELINLGRRDLGEWTTPHVTYEADVSTWVSNGLADADTLEVGDTIQLVDRSFSPTLRLQARVIGLEDDLLAGLESRRLTLGSIIQTISERQTIITQTAQTVATGKPVWDRAAVDSSTATNVATGAAAGADSALQAAANAVSTALDAKEMASGMEGRLAAVETTVASLPDEYQPKGEYLVAEDISGLLSADDIQPGDGVTVSKSDDGKLTVSARGPFPPATLDNGADLDTVREYGLYRKQWGDVVANAPSGDAESSFLLTVIPMTDDGEDSDVLQRVEPAGGVGAVTEPFYRNYSGSGGWTPWRKYAAETGADANDK